MRYLHDLHILREKRLVYFKARPDEFHEPRFDLQQFRQGHDLPNGATTPRSLAGLPTGARVVDDIVLGRDPEQGGVRDGVRRALGPTLVNDILDETTRGYVDRLTRPVGLGEQAIRWVGKRGSREVLTVPQAERVAREDVLSPAMLDNTRIHNLLEANVPVRDMLQQRLGRAVMGEISGFPLVKYAVAFLFARPTPPGALAYLTAALGGGTGYNEAKRTQKATHDAHHEFKHHTEHLVAEAGKLSQAARKLTDYQPALNDLQTQLANANRDVTDAQTAMANAARTAGTNAGPLTLAQTQLADAQNRRNTVQQKMADLNKEVKNIKDAVGELYSILHHFVPAPGAPAPAAGTLGALLVAGAGTPERHAYDQIHHLCDHISRYNPLGGGGATVVQFSGAIQEISNGHFKTELEHLTPALSVEEERLERAAKEANTNFELAKTTRDTNVTPAGLMFSLYSYYYGHDVAHGGVLPNGTAVVPSPEDLRNVAAMSTRQAMAIARSHTNVPANRYRAERLYARARWYRRAFSSLKKTESFDNVLERFRHIEVDVDGVKTNPFVDLGLKPDATREEIRQAVADGRLEEKHIPRLYLALERALRDSKTFRLKVEDIPHIQDMIRNLKIVRHEISHKKMMQELAADPGTKGEKLAKMLQETMDADIAEEAKISSEVAQASFVEQVSLKGIAAKKELLMEEVKNKMATGEMDASQAQAYLAQHGVDKGIANLWLRKKFAGKKSADGSDETDENGEYKPGLLRRAGTIVTAPVWGPFWALKKTFGLVGKGYGLLDSKVLGPGRRVTGKFIGGAFQHVIPTPFDVTRRVATLARGKKGGGDHGGGGGH